MKVCKVCKVSVLAGVATLASASSWAQSAPAVLHGEAPRSSATAAPYVDPPAVRDERLRILYQEREAAQKRMSDAMGALPKAPDQAAAVAALTRMQGDLIALEKEIKSVEARRPATGGSAGAWTPKKPAASAAGSMTQEPESAKANFEAWDVFRNFGQTGTTP